MLNLNISVELFFRRQNYYIADKIMNYKNNGHIKIRKNIYEKYLIILIFYLINSKYNDNKNIFNKYKNFLTFVSFKHEYIKLVEKYINIEYNIWYHYFKNINSNQYNYYKYIDVIDSFTTRNIDKHIELIQISYSMMKKGYDMYDLFDFSGLDLSNVDLETLDLNLM